MSTTRGSAAIRLFSIAALALAGLAAVELAVRVSARLRTGVWPLSRAETFYAEILDLRRIYRRHAFLNTGPREGGRVEVFGKQASLNGLGYRSPERPLAKPAGVRRVLVSGGSAVFDVLAAGDEHTWPWRLEAELVRDRPGIEVWNGGFPGWTSQESLIALAIRDLDLSPDVVLLLHGGNDAQPASHRPFDPQYEEGHAEIARRAAGLEIAAPPIWKRLVLIDKLVDWTGDPADPWLALGRPASAGAARRRALEPEGRDAFARNLRSALALTGARGVRTILATQPVRIRTASREADLAWLAGWFPELEPESAAAAVEELNEITRRIASSAVAGVADVRLADLARDILWDDADFGDPLHFSDAGRAKLVGYLGPIVGSALEPASP